MREEEWGEAADGSSSRRQHCPWGHLVFIFAGSNVYTITHTTVSSPPRAATVVLVCTNGTRNCGTNNFQVASLWSRGYKVRLTAVPVSNLIPTT